MYSNIFLSSLLVAIIIWDFKFSRASKVLSELREKEPEIYNSIQGKSFMPPTSCIGQVIGRGLYLKIETKQIKDEIVAFDNRRWRSVLWPRAIYIGYIFLLLILSAIHKG